MEEVIVKGLLGRKLGMTQVFTEDGLLIPVTVIEAEPNVVLQVKTEATDGIQRCTARIRRCKRKKFDKT